LNCEKSTSRGPPKSDTVAAPPAAFASDTMFAISFASAPATGGAAVPESSVAATARSSSQSAIASALRPDNAPLFNFARIDVRSRPSSGISDPVSTRLSIASNDLCIAKRIASAVM
jgi:hypothetical protein